MERKRIMVLLLILLAAAAVFLLCGCSLRRQPSEDEPYHMISQEEAARMMEKNDGHVVVDVRRMDEYEEKHIPGAVCIPNESIGDEMPRQLPDKDQVILIYCRSGNRSKQAAQKLADMGYTNLYEFGGIIDWKGDTVGGPEPYGGYDMDPVAVPVVMINDRYFTFELEDNPSADAFFKKLKQESLELELHDYGGFEKVGDLPWELPRNDGEITTQPGDIILYQGSQITIYYDENTWNLTRLGRIWIDDDENFKEVLGDGDVTAHFYLEWSE